MNKSVAVGMAIAAATLSLSACGGEDSAITINESDSDLVRAAKQEGSITWYSGDTPVANERLAEAFEERYGIKVEAYKTTDLETKYAAERGSGQVVADVISTGTPGFFIDGLAKGWFEKLDGTLVPNYVTWPEEYRTDAYAVISVEPFLVAYNTDLVGEADVPKSWGDLLSDKNSGRLLALDPRVIPAYLNQYAVWQKKLGDDFLAELGAAGPALIDSSVPGAQALAAGEQAFLFPTSQNQVNDLIDKGAPIDTTVLGPATGVQVNMSLSKGASSPNAARLFMDWVLSDEGQGVLIGDTGKVSPPDAETSDLLPSDYEQPDAAEALQHREEILQLLGLSG